MTSSLHLIWISVKQLTNFREKVNPNFSFIFSTKSYKTYRNVRFGVRKTDVTKTSNGERRTGNGERESGNECTAVTRLRIQPGGQRKRKGNNLGKMCILGDPGASSRDEAIFSGESLLQERKSPWELMLTEPVPVVEFRPADWSEKYFFWPISEEVQPGNSVNKAWNSAWGENRIGIITCYPNQSVQNADCRPGTKCRLQYG